MLIIYKQFYIVKFLRARAIGEGVKKLLAITPAYHARIQYRDHPAVTASADQPPESLPELNDRARDLKMFEWIESTFF